MEKLLAHNIKGTQTIYKTDDGWDVRNRDAKSTFEKQKDDDQDWFVDLINRRDDLILTKEGKKEKKYWEDFSSVGNQPMDDEELDEDTKAFELDETTRYPLSDHFDIKYNIIYKKDKDEPFCNLLTDPEPFLNALIADEKEINSIDEDGWVSLKYFLPKDRLFNAIVDVYNK